MDIKKRITALLMIPVITITLILCDVKKTYAVVEWLPAYIIALVGLESSTDYQQFYDNNVDKFRNGNRWLLEKTGLPSTITEGISDTNSILNSIAMDPIQAYRYWFQSTHNNETISDAECKAAVTNMYSNCIVGNDNSSFTFSSDLKNFIKWEQSQIIANTGYFYVYSFNLIDAINTVQSGQYYNTLRQFLLNYQDDYYCYLTGSLSYAPSSSTNFWLVPKDPDVVFLRNNEFNNICGFYNYSQSNWTQYNNFRVFEYNTSTLSFNEIQSSSIGNYIYSQKDTSLRTVMLHPGWLSVGRYDCNICYRTLADLKNQSLGIKPYYINNSVYNDFSTSSGDFTIDSSNSNNASYGDISNYINSFNNEHGTYPTTDDINIFIENRQPDSPSPTPNPNPDNPSGGGSGSSSATATANNQGVNVTVNNNHSINFTVPSLSGNGTSSGGTVSGNGSGSNNFFDWLGNLGSIIGNLIKGIGEALVGIFEGVAEAVTTIMESIPNILSPLMEFVFGGLPDEIKALMTLGITCVIFVGVIKAIKR